MISEGDSSFQPWIRYYVFYIATKSVLVQLKLYFHFFTSRMMSLRPRALHMLPQPWQQTTEPVVSCLWFCRGGIIVLLPGWWKEEVTSKFLIRCLGRKLYTVHAVFWFLCWVFFSKAHSTITSSCLVGHQKFVLSVKSIPGCWFILALYIYTQSSTIYTVQCEYMSYLVFTKREVYTYVYKV